VSVDAAPRRAPPSHIQFPNVTYVVSRAKSLRTILFVYSMFCIMSRAAVAVWVMLYNY